VPTDELLRTYGSDYRVVIVGDAAMSPYEIIQPGGSVEHWNAESGEVWLTRLCDTFERVVWLNPTPERAWSYSQSASIIRRVIADRMHPLTLGGLEAAMKYLSR
jgi:uncharacterized protein with von Willebrand factor type A (vWA) domain